jgi:hypothetical protein
MPTWPQKLDDSHIIEATRRIFSSFSKAPFIPPLPPSKDIVQPKASGGPPVGPLRPGPPQVIHDTVEEEDDFE